MTHTDTDTVLVIGEALIDIVEQSGGDDEFVGGSPANVAVGIARQGVSTTLLTRLGRDDRGRRIADQVAASGAAIEESSWTDAATSTARARLRADGSAEYDFDIVWALDAAAVDAAAGAASVIHAGSIALFLRPGGEVALAALENARSAGRIVTVDPNIRPALVGDTPRPVAERAFAAATLVKLSDEDADALYPGMPAEQVLETITALGPQVVVMTRGGEGALALGPSGAVDVAPLTVDVADTIGAGDAFMASLITSVVDDADLLAGDADALRRALRRAAVMAGITVSRPGANPPTRAEVDAAL
ncbi:PfkB family carbohydrate kinase [Microbacterium oleivorans]|uniref:PfkB domain protein n=1 Tax=Microbacterium oleivorans TaxID=273677 RepID=A0A031FXL5_9MICO|nr:PfkB family carbohydrate kinase [Microbacterium oleivorans]EZP29017.1 PfkB domain protein [Microbacterium oleivorans]